VKREYWKYITTIFPYLKRHKGFAAVSMVTMVLGALISLAVPWPLGLLVDTLGKTPPPHFITELVGTTQSELITFIAVISIVIVLVKSVIGVADSYVNTTLEQQMALEFRTDLFEHCTKLSQGFHDFRSLGDFIYRINFEAHHVGEVTVSIPALLQSFGMLVGMFVITYLIDPMLALLTLAVVPFIYLSIGIYGNHIEPRLIKVRWLEGQSLSIVHEVFSRLKVVVGFNRQAYESDRFTEQGNNAVHQRIRITVAQTVFNLGVGLITAIGTGAIIWVGAHQVVSGKLNAGALIVVLSYVASIYQPMQTISSTMGEFQNHFVALRFARQLMETEPDIKEMPGAHSLRHIRGAITFDDVSFDYPTRQGTLKHISFSVEPGQVVAIVGPTGAGKSTLVNLILRFYEPKQGRVLIDGHDIRTVTQHSLREQIGLVLQEPLLLGGTVEENIRYGRTDASDAEIAEAAKAANAHDFIMALPNGYKTQLGEGGARLSGGERQRLCIARAFVKRAPILILDEPTSAIDSGTESLILDALDRLMVGRTTFMIAHRLSSVRHADLILVIDDGALVECGTHDDLAGAGGLYSGLNDMQSGRKSLRARTVPELPALEVPSTTNGNGVPTGPIVVTSGAEAPDGPVATEVPTVAEAVDPESLPWTAPAPARRPRVVVLGMMAKSPVPGVVWQTIHYLVGLERLGFEAYYVEAHARIPSMLMRSEDDDATGRAVAFLAGVMRRFGFEHRWAFHALHEDDRCYGLSAAELQRLYRSAALIINLSGSTRPRPEHQRGGALVYIETDPVMTQLDLHQQRQETIDLLEPHAAFFTFAENLGRPDCGLPVPDRFEFLPTRQPLVLEFWEGQGDAPATHLTTVANWHQGWRDVQFNDETYTWSKDLEFRKVLELPSRCSQRFELALTGCPEDDQRLLREHGWELRLGSEVLNDLDAYRAFISQSRGEFTVAKDQNVRLRTGWFSDRSASYLAAGRPVVTQETGFSSVLPVGRGLFAFEGMADAAAAVHELNAHYEDHRVAARAIAAEYFAHDRVLKPVLEHVGLSPARRRYGVLRPDAVVPDELDLAPGVASSGALDDGTVQSILERPWPTPRRRGTVLLGPRRAASAVVVTHDGLAHTRLCIESALANTQYERFEIIVVDNGSSDGTAEYLEHLAGKFGSIQVVLNEHDEGRGRAVNQGLSRAEGRILVVLRNDVIVPPHWLVDLVQHLEEPETGLLSPVTNHSVGEASAPAPYRRYDDLLTYAAERRRCRSGTAPETETATPACLALRRDVYEAVGPLHEQLEGDELVGDYVRRVKNAGYAVRRAEDVFVHSFEPRPVDQVTGGFELFEMTSREDPVASDHAGTDCEANFTVPHEIGV
jgi:ABC-type multidrug transport system fused ATPase/permease subunit